MFFSSKDRIVRGNMFPIVQRLTAWLLVFLFLVTPITRVLADDVTQPPADQNSGTSTTPPSDTTTPPTDSNTPPVTPPTDQTPSDTQANPDQPTPDTTELPKEPDKIRRKSVVEPSNATGALNYEYPITVAPGRNSLQPDIKLSYNSQSSAIDSIIAQGWSVSIPSIERINKTGADNLFTSNYYTSSLSDELVGLGNNNYAAKVDNGEFISYTFTNNVWVAVDKTGTRYTFGSTAASRQDNPNDSSKIFKWMISEIRDTNDNYIKFEYTKDSGQIYPSDIKYTGSGSTDGIFEVDFILQARTDITTSTQYGFTVTTNSRIQEIQSKVNANWTKRYVLNYGTADNGTRSVLNSVTESGKDESNNIKTLPPESFSYQQKTKSVALDSNWTFPMLLADQTGDQGVRMFDANGDGLVDMIQSLKPTGQNPVRNVYINNGQNGWIHDTNWTIPLDFVNGTSDNGVHFEDVNGDGLIDLIRNNEVSSSGNGVYLNNGNGTGWTLNTSWSLPAAAFTTSENPDNGVRMADANGDGLIDFIQSVPQSSGPAITKVFLNTGNGWEQYTIWTIPVTFSDRYNDTGVRLVDVNGDGNVDIVKSNGYNASTNGVYLNNGNGTGWTLNSTWTIPVYFYEDNGATDKGVRMADMNGDGLVDLVQSYRPTTISNPLRRVYINNGVNGWTLDTGWGTDASCTITVDFVKPSGYNKGVDIGDVNGDGLADIIEDWQGSGNDLHQSVFISSGNKADLLSTITIPEGAQTTIQYKGSPQYKDTSNNLLNPKLLLPLETVSHITVNDGFGNTNNTSYSYSNGKYYFGDYLNRKFSGFGKVTATDQDGNTTTTSFHGGTQNEPTLGEYNEDISKMGNPYRIEVKNANGNLFSKTINQWDRVDLGNGRNFVKLNQTVDSVYDGNSSHKDKAETYQYNSSNGNKTQTQQMGEVSGNDDGTFTDVGTDLYLTTVSYTNNTSNGVIGLPVDELTNDYYSNKVKETRHYYDNQTLGQVVNGNETKTELWRASNKYINTQKAYNSYGLVTSDTDPNGKVTNYSYDTYNLYPTSSTNPLSQTTNYTYNYSSGTVEQTTDPNNRIFVTTYDGLDRPLQETQPDQINPTTQVTKTSYSYTDNSNAMAVQKTDYLDANNGVDSYTYFDGFGRKIQQRSEAATSNHFNVRDFVYENDGLLLKESLPYDLTGSSWTTPTTTSALYTNYTYDTMKRVLTSIVSASNWTTTNTYDDWKTTVTDADGKIKDIYKDAYDNLVRVDEHNNGQVYSTTYNWNGLQKLLKITDANSNIRNFTYDGLGRVLSAQDLHSPDPNETTFGTWYYSYDASSNLISRTDPNSQVVTYSYDDINRVLTEDSSTTLGVDVTYTYDSCSDGVGRLCSVVNSALSTTNTYNALGQIITEMKIIDGLKYQTLYTYDRQGNQTLITNPDSSKVQYLYNAAGTVNQIQRREKTDSGFINVISSISYNPVGLPLVINYANGAVTTNTYDADHLYRLSHKVTVANNSNVQDLTYTYDPVGNITRIVDASTTQTAKTTDYTYDDLHRLLSSVISTPSDTSLDGDNITQSFTYDAIGNILTKSDVGTYSYDGNQGSSYANPHAVTSANGVSYSYDNNGNMTGSGLMTQYNWDYNNRLVQVTTGLPSYSYSYDSNGQRVKSTSSQGTTYEPTQYYSATNNVAEKHIFLGDQAIATIQGSGSNAQTFTIHADHLTGSNVVTDNSQNIDELTDYYSFGTMRLDNQSGSLQEKRKFTGHEYDVDTGLTYASARYYDATLGKWLSEDPLFLDISGDVKSKYNKDLYEILGDPQQLNSYSYVTNNPLKYIDVTGNLRIDALFGNWQQVGSTISQWVSWRAFSGVIDAAGYHLTSSLMNHALSINPGAVTISEQNQKDWGNAVDRVRESSDFNKSMSDYLSHDAKNGSIDKTYDAAHGSIVFRDGDLQSGIHGTYSTGVKGTQNKDGSWNLNISITDRYDYTNQNYPGGEKSNLLSGANNAANMSQNQGVISNYGLTINFNIPNYKSKTKK